MDTDGNLCSLFNFSQLKNIGATAEISSGTGLLIALFVIFLCFSAYFSGTECGFSSMNKIRIKSKADEGDKRAKTAMYISNNYERALTTLLIGNNIVNIAAASVSTLIATRIFGTSNTVTVLCTVITTLIVFLIKVIRHG